MLLSALPLSPARVFAELLAPPLGARGRENEPVPGLLGGRSSAVPPGREVHVSGSAELCAAPDRARISIRLGSRKQEAGEARSSVTRRLEYIAQSARQRGVQDLEISCEGPSLHSGHCFVEDLEGNLPLNPAHKLIMKFCTSMSKENVTVTKDFSRVENAYQMEAEVCITFSDFGKMQNVCNLLIEKLGSSVTISPPHFYHTAEAIDTLRRQVCLAAVGNTRRKAQEVCRLFGQSLGKPLLIREEEMKEWEGQIDSHPSNSSNTLTVQQRIQSATIYVSSKIFAIFEIKRQEKRKNKLI